MLGARGFGCFRRAHWLALIPIITMVAVGLGMIALRDDRADATQNLNRFATMTFGARAGSAALQAGDVSAAATPVDFTKYRTPNGWRLRPAGTQIDTQRAPTGVAVSPDAQTAVAVNSGIFDEQITVVNTSTLAKTLEFTTDLYMGAVINDANDLWLSTGSRNRIFQYKLAGGTAQCVRCSKVLPGAPDAGPLPAINVIGYPGNMALGSDARLFVAGNLSVPSTYIDGKDGVPGDGPICAGGSRICSVVNVVDVSDPLAQAPAVRYIPVGRDAFGLALNEAQGKLYVSNWADETDPSRGGGKGTVSVIDLATETEVQVVAVGHHPTALALNPAGGTLFVANTEDDSLSKLALGPDGLVTSTSTIDVRTTPDAPRAAAPLTLSFTVDGAYLLVGLAGQNALEVRTAAGATIPRTVRLGKKFGFALNVPHTYIPTGWYPSAQATAAHPDVATATRLYVANLKGIGAGPGENAQASPTIGVRTQGVLQVIDVPVDPTALNNSFDNWTAKTVKSNKWVPLFKTTLSDPANDPCLAAPLPAGGSVLSNFLCNQSKKKTGASPYHIVYIVKENKTFDAFFGDVKTRGLPDANADTSFLLFGEDGGTKNQHNLARLFTVGDGFWADSEQSTTGHSWTSAGYATEYNEITWNPEYSEGLRGNRWGGQYEGQAPGPTLRDQEIAEQEGELFDPAARLVDLMANPATNPRAVTFRVYSDDVNHDTPAVQQQVPLSLWGIGSSAVHHGRDLDFPDTDRAHLFLNGSTISHAWSGDQGPPPASYQKEIGLCGAPDDPLVVNAPDSFCTRPGSSPGEYEKFSLNSWTAQYQACRAQGSDDKTCQSGMPNFLYMALPVDHTLGYNPLSPSPQSMVADNDYATGLVVDALSKSPFWRNTLVVITEDDTQLAGDHVDAHRTFLLAAGGLARRHGPQGSASHQQGSFPSILKTVEVLFRLPTLTIYDRAAVPLHDFVVQGSAYRNSVVYTAVDPGVPFAVNPVGGTLATLSKKVDWSLDRGDPDLVTAIMYNGIRGRPLPEKYQQLARE